MKRAKIPHRLPHLFVRIAEHDGTVAGCLLNGQIARMHKDRGWLELQNRIVAGDDCQVL